jgi:hypothetical protein
LTGGIRRIVSGFELSEDIRKAAGEIIVGNADSADRDDGRVECCLGRSPFEMLHDGGCDEFQQRETRCKDHLKDVVWTAAQDILTGVKYR